MLKFLILGPSKTLETGGGNFWGRLKYGTGSTEHGTRNEFREKIA